MRVKAIATGFYAGARRRVGAEFEVKDGESADWFVPLEAPKRTRAQAAPAPAAPEEQPAEPQSDGLI